MAAPDDNGEHASAETVYRTIYGTNPEYFELIDALASHSYPNHGFVGKPADSGQHSIRGYQWELNLIRSLGINKTYPVFITETGWPHREGESTNNSFYTAKTTATFLNQAIGYWYRDSRILAITPFIYNYPYPPFDHFSWLTKEGRIYPDYQQILDLPKYKNYPAQVTSYSLEKIKLPLLVTPNTDHLGQLYLKNTGQSIWGEKAFCLENASSPNFIVDAVCTDDTYVYPNQTKIFTFKFRMNSENVPESFISWRNLPQIKILPVLGNSHIYHPQTGFRQKIINWLRNLTS